MRAAFGAALVAVVTVVVASAASAALANISSVVPVVRAATFVAGCIAASVVFFAVNNELAAADDTIVDPADRMAGMRVALRTGASGRGASRTAPRKLESGAMVFLTVEPGEVRVEALLSVADFADELGIAGKSGTIAVSEQLDLNERARKLAGEALQLIVDGREAVALFERSDFVTVAATGVATRARPQPEALATAVLGVTRVYGVDRPPSEIRLTWTSFSTAVHAIPAGWADPTGAGRTTLTKQKSSLAWSNDLSSFAIQPPRPVLVEPARMPVLSLLLAIVVAALGSRLHRGVSVVVLAIAVACYPFVRMSVPLPAASALSKTRALSVVDDLLTNVYSSFGLRNESAIYDRLSVSVTGNQLADVYLENRRALELENRGGARARVDEVEVAEIASVSSDDDGNLVVSATWTVSGSVNHFGHVHYRQNRYEANLRLVAENGVWKLTKIDLLDERRIL